MKDELKLSFLNVCGLKTKLLFPEFENFLKSHDIIGVAETKTCEEDVISFIGYSYFPKHRKHFVRRSGGLGVFVKDDVLPFVELIETDSEILILIKFRKH